MYNETNQTPDQYLCDKDVAKILCVSPAWVRKQRYLRKNEAEHILPVSPVYIGRNPRYKSSEIQGWLRSL